MLKRTWPPGLLQNVNAEWTVDGKPQLIKQVVITSSLVFFSTSTDAMWAGVPQVINEQLGMHP